MHDSVLCQSLDFCQEVAADPSVSLHCSQADVWELQKLVNTVHVVSIILSACTSSRPDVWLNNPGRK